MEVIPFEIQSTLPYISVMIYSKSLFFAGLIKPMICMSFLRDGTGFTMALIGKMCPVLIMPKVGTSTLVILSLPVLKY